MMLRERAGFIMRISFLKEIKPHYRSEGPRQGSCGVFGGMFHTIETTTMEYLISELSLNYQNQKISGIKF